MKRQSKLLIWLPDSKGTPLPQLAKELEKLGFSHATADLKKLDSFSNECAAVCLMSLTGIDQVSKWVKTLPQPTPIFLIAKSMTELQALPLLVDDFFLEDSSSSEFVARLHLRSQHVLRSRKDQVGIAARAETILKQREEFLGVAAHDLRSPLGLIQTSMSMLLNHKNQLDDFQKNIATRVHRQATQALGLVKDLLDVMSFEQGLKPIFQLVSLHQILKDFHDDYQITAEKNGIHFHYENEVPNWRVLVDSDRLSQLLQNLLSNALKFTEKGKNIFLRVTPFKGRRKTDPPFPMVIITLRDEGRGIAKSELQKIFDRFSQISSHARQEGRGLGLTVAKQISNLHDGNLWVESEPGKGSTFFVLIPHVVGPEPEKHCTSKKVLVALPQNFEKNTLVANLSDLGFHVRLVTDGAKAITFSYYEKPDAILLGNRLDKVDSTEVASLLKSDPNYQNTKIILLDDGKEVDSKWKETFDERLPFSVSKESIEKALD